MGRLLLLACGLLCVLYTVSAARSNAAKIAQSANAGGSGTRARNVLPPAARAARVLPPAARAGKVFVPAARAGKVVVPSSRVPSNPIFRPPFGKGAVPAARRQQTIITGRRINPIVVRRPGIQIQAPVVRAPVSTGVRATPRRVDASATRARAAAASASRHASIKSSSRARIVQDSSRKLAFSAPRRTGQAAAARLQFSQGGKVVPLRSLARNKGRVTQNGSPIAFFITDFLVIIDGIPYFIDPATNTIIIGGIHYVICGADVLPASVYVCCSGIPLLRFDPANGFEQIQCCGDEFFFPASEICCDGFFAPKFIDGFATACAGSTIYFPSFQINCHGVIWETGDPFIDISVLSCCGTEAFDNRFDSCCNGVVVIGDSTSSCGCLGVTQRCCFGVPISIFSTCNFNPIPPVISPHYPYVPQPYYPPPPAPSPYYPPPPYSGYSGNVYKKK